MQREHRSRWILSAATLVALTACVQPNTVRTGTSTAESRWAGVFVTAADYRADAPAARIACQTSTSPIDRQSFAHSAAVEVGDPRMGSAIKYPKDSLFGFRACDGSTVRFSSGENYQVVQQSPMYLYDVERTVDVGKGPERVHDFFFSVAPDDAIQPLTLSALKSAYPTNRRFREELDAAFHTDADLTQFDDTQHEYKVALILRECLQ